MIRDRPVGASPPAMIAALISGSGKGNMRFKDRVLFVTGGGSGIGAATARRFASEGGRVAVVDLSRENAAKIANALPEGQAIAIGIDVSDEAAVKSAIAETHQKF